jgi:hypothetical protein
MPHEFAVRRSVGPENAIPVGLEPCQPAVSAGSPVRNVLVQSKGPSTDGGDDTRDDGRAVVAAGSHVQHDGLAQVIGSDVELDALGVLSREVVSAWRGDVVKTSEWSASC